MSEVKLIKKRIGSIANTCKITRTMEMVSTAKSKKMIDRLNATRPYQRKLSELISVTLENIQDTGRQGHSPYLRKVAKIRKLALIVFTANRGLCGGYNTNLLRLAHRHYQKIHTKGIDCDLHVIGKKGLGYFKFLKLPVKTSYVDVDDNLKYEQSEKLASYFMQEFGQGRYDCIEIASTCYHSAAQQKPAIIPFLPLDFTSQNTKLEDTKLTLKSNHVFEPGADTILKHALPLSIKAMFYGVLLEGLASEQILRRIAMKNASDAAEDMLTLLNRSYNRARQASITQELAEIVSGADAL